MARKAPTETITERIPLASLRPHPRNYQQHPPEQIKKLAASLKRFGQRKNIVAWQQDGFCYVVAGHGLLEAAQTINFPALEANVFPIDTSEDEVLGYMVADNETARWAEPDLAQLEALLQEQLDAGYPLESVGFTLDELEALTQQLEQETAAQGRRAIDDPCGGGDDFDTSQAETRCKAGDLWQLGRHRLHCGDSTKAEDVARLMDGALIDFVFTSPPYNVGVEYASHDDSTVSWAEYGEFLRRCLEAFLPCLATGRALAWNIGSSPKTFPHHQYLLLEQMGLTYFRTLVWQKVGVPVPLFHNTRTHPVARQFTPNYTHEWVGIFTKGDLIKGSAVTFDDTLEHDVFRMHQTMATVDLPNDPHGARTGHQSALETRARKAHPAAFPVALPAAFVQHLADIDAIVYEPFCGSGSSVIACERLARRCYGLEIEPRYCDVILARWEAETGEKAVRM